MQQVDTLGSRTATFHLQEGCLSTVEEIKPFCSYFNQPSRRTRQCPQPTIRHCTQHRTGRAFAWRPQVNPSGHFLEETETGATEGQMTSLDISRAHSSLCAYNSVECLPIMTDKPPCWSVISCEGHFSFCPHLGARENLPSQQPHLCFP